MGTSKKNKGKKNNKNVKKNVTFSEPVTNNNNNLGKNKVSILTVSQVKRIPFLHNLSKMIEYQKDSLIFEWIITNGSTNDEDYDKFNEEIKKVTCKIPIKHVASKDLKYRNIGAFRNLANRNASGDIIVCMDDDDFYFPDYIKTCYEVLTQKKNIDVVGCSGMFMYDYGFDTVFRLASFGPNHTVNCCLAYRRDYFNSHKYDETRVTGEELSFLNKYESRMFQLPPTSALIHMSYADNTFSGKRLNMLNNMGSWIRAPDQVPNIYSPMSSSLKSLIKNDEIFDSYMKNFSNINNQKETDIVFYYGHLEEEWNPEDKDLMVYRRRCFDLGKEFIKKGLSVSVYGKFDFNELEKDGIFFYNLKFWNVRRKCKYLIFVDYTGFVPICQYERIIEKINCEQMYIDTYSNLFQFYRFVTYFNFDKVTFVLKNPYHIHMNPPDSKRKLKYKMKNLIVPSGIDKELFQKDYEIQREPKRMCWTCKYDNGLNVVLKHFWPEILKKHPESEFHVYYGFNGIDDNLKKEIEPLLLQDGVTHHGRVSHEEIAKEYQRSSFLFYYTATPNECDCVSVMEALASGCIPILWNKNVFSCFHGLLSPDVPMNLDSFIKLASKVSELMERDDERNRVIEKFKRSDTVISNEAAATIFMSAFEGKSDIAEVKPDERKPEAPKSNVTNNISNMVPSGINLQNYVDSDSDSDEESNKPKANINLQNYVDSDSDVEYESDSEDEQEKRNRLAQAEEDMVDRELAKEKLEDFISSEIFKGSKFGYIFKNGDKGIGYYKDQDLSDVKKIEESNDGK